MNSQDILTVNLVGAGAFILWYVISGRGNRPTRLNMKAKDSVPPLVTAAPETEKAADIAPVIPIARSEEHTSELQSH